MNNSLLILPLMPQKVVDKINVILQSMFLVERSSCEFSLRPAALLSTSQHHPTYKLTCPIKYQKKTAEISWILSIRFAMICMQRWPVWRMLMHCLYVQHRIPTTSFCTYIQINLYSAKSRIMNQRRWHRVTRQWKQTGRNVTSVDA